MALLALAKKSIAVAMAGTSVYITNKKGVWGDGDQSKKAWDELRETLSNTSTSSSKPVASALQVRVGVVWLISVFTFLWHLFQMSGIRLVSTETLKIQWNRQLHNVFFGAAQAVGPGGLVERIRLQVTSSLPKLPWSTTGTEENR
jgi:hypothetical protein